MQFTSFKSQANRGFSSGIRVCYYIPPSLSLGRQSILQKFFSAGYLYCRHCYALCILNSVPVPARQLFCQKMLTGLMFLVTVFYCVIYLFVFLFWNVIFFLSVYTSKLSLSSFICLFPFLVLLSLFSFLPFLVPYCVFLLTRIAIQDVTLLGVTV